MKSILIILFATFSFGQQLNVKYIKTSTDSFPTIVSTLQVYDSFQNPIEGLTKDNFVTAVDGNETEKLNAVTYEKSGIGCYIMLCVDLSGSMKGKPLQSLKNAILSFIDDMRSIDKLAIVGFSDSYQLICDFSNNKSYLKKEVNQMQTSGTRTALFYGIYKGLEDLKNINDAAQIAIVISDGKDNPQVKSYSDDDVISLAQENGIPVFTIGYTNGDKSYFQILEKIANQTGGSFYDSPSDNDLKDQYKKLYKQILNIYLVTHRTDDNKADGLEHVVAMTVTHLNSSKTVSSKFSAPAGIITKKGKSTDNQTNEEGNFWENYFYLIISFAVISLGAVTWFIINRKKKQRQIEEQKRIEAEKSIEEENRKLQQAEAPNFDNFTQPQKNEFDSVPQRGSAKTILVDEKTVILKPEEDKTIILREGESSSVSMLILDIAVGSYAGQSFQVSTYGATIGRAPDNTIQLLDGTVSGHHAKISYNNGKFYLEDLGSSNGTFINGNRITVSELTNGSVFKIGACEGYIRIS